MPHHSIHVPRLPARTRWPLAAVALLGSTMALAAQSSTFIDRQLVHALEQRFARAHIADWSAISGLVVAGGSMTRIAEALRLARQYPHLRIVLSGPGDDEVAAARRAEGVDPARVVIERVALNTHENAVLSKRVIAPEPGDRWLLITSAAHMPRAIGSFYGARFPVEPWPVLDTREAAGLSQVARHEWIGLVVYWLRGRTIALFPGQSHVDLMRTAGRASPDA